MASPFLLRLGTNYCPTDDEVVDIKDFLVEPTLRLKELGDKIAELQQTIDKLAEERDGIRAYVEAHKALISPVRRLPLDILQEIFTACLPTHRNCVMSASEAPVLLGRICRSWRALSLLTPQLWARLHVAEPLRVPDADDGLFDQKVAQRIEITKTWLGRSGQCPLSISLKSAEYNRTFPASDTFASIQILRALISFAPRWQHIHFTTPPLLILKTMSSLDTDMPWLETVIFSHDFDSGLNDVDWGPFDMLRGARISGFSASGSIFVPQKLPLLWNRLTTLTIGGPESWRNMQQLTSEAIFPLISRCYELRSCTLMIHDAIPDIPILQHAMAELPFLHTLSVHCVMYAAPTVTILLMRLTLPQLRNFTFTGPMEDTPSLQDWFASLTCLESLNIDLRLFSKPHLLESFYGLPPSIQQLQIRQLDSVWGSNVPPTCLDDAALAVLASPGSCPALQSLQIDHGLCLSEAAVLQFIIARMLESPFTLKHVGIQFERIRQKGHDIMTSLHPFIELGTGLTVSLVYLTPSSWEFSPWRGLADAPAPDGLCQY
ncbi:hypothetical protein K438DRAFT_1804442 [Mycena galopus ATCC 62051]|nr:hypothetical protein K438DRAFT_1804442 [Mycena galopus ATCC 62051]